MLYRYVRCTNCPTTRYCTVRKYITDSTVTQRLDAVKAAVKVVIYDPLRVKLSQNTKVSIQNRYHLSSTQRLNQAYNRVNLKFRHFSYWELFATNEIKRCVHSNLFKRTAFEKKLFMMLPIFDIDYLCTAMQLDGTKRTKRSHKRVRFTKRVQVFEIPNARFLSNRQRHALWYPEPVKKGKNQIVMQLILCGVNPGDSEDGGKLHPSEHKNKAMETRLPVSAVLAEQENQREYGHYDPHIIAKMYCRCSAHSSVRAQMRGRQDELEIQEYISARPHKRKRKRIMNFLKRTP